MISRITNLFDKYAALFLSLALVGLIEFIFTIEWSFQGCGDPRYDESTAIFGMPFPYMTYSMASSMEYVFVVSIYIVNIVLLLLLTWPIVAFLLRSFIPPLRRNYRIGLGIISMLVAIIVFRGHLVFAHFTSLSTGDLYPRYTQLRPIGFIIKDLHYDCTPSPFWFPQPGNPK